MPFPERTNSRLLLLSGRECRRAVRPRRAPAMPSAQGRHRSERGQRERRRPVPPGAARSDRRSPRTAPESPSDRWRVRAPARREAPRQAAATNAAERVPTIRTRRGKACSRARPATRERTTANGAPPRRARTARHRPDVRPNPSERPPERAAESPWRPSPDGQAARWRRQPTPRKDRSAPPGPDDYEAREALVRAGRWEKSAGRPPRRSGRWAA